MVDYRGSSIDKFSTDPHIPDMTVSSVVSASYTVVDITDNENCATVIDHHIKINMMAAVQTAHLTTMQWNLDVAPDMLAQHWSIPLQKAKRPSSAPLNMV